MYAAGWTPVQDSNDFPDDIDRYRYSWDGWGNRAGLPGGTTAKDVLTAARRAVRRLKEKRS